MELILSGSSGFLGHSLLRHISKDADIRLSILRTTSRPLPDTLPQTHVVQWVPDRSLEELLQRLTPLSPTHIIHIGALSDPARCEAHPSEAHKANDELTKVLAELALETGAHLIYTSTDLVFDGNSTDKRPLTENAAPLPQSVYARTKYAGEAHCRNVPHSAVVRLSLLYGDPAGPNAGGMTTWMTDSMRSKKPITLFSDEFRTPAFVEDVALAILNIAREKHTGTWHCGGPERLSRVEFGLQVARALGLDPNLITSGLRRDFPARPSRPEDVSLDSSKLYGSLGAFRTVQEALTGLSGR